MRTTDGLQGDRRAVPPLDDGNFPSTRSASTPTASWALPGIIGCLTRRGAASPIANARGTGHRRRQRRSNPATCPISWSSYHRRKGDSCKTCRCFYNLAPAGRWCRQPEITVARQTCPSLVVKEVHGSGRPTGMLCGARRASEKKGKTGRFSAKKLEAAAVRTTSPSPRWRCPPFPILTPIRGWRPRSRGPAGPFRGWVAPDRSPSRVSGRADRGRRA